MLGVLGYQHLGDCIPFSPSVCPLYSSKHMHQDKILPLGWSKLAPSQLLLCLPTVSPHRHLTCHLYTSQSAPDGEQEGKQSQRLFPKAFYNVHCREDRLSQNTHSGSLFCVFLKCHVLEVCGSVHAWVQSCSSTCTLALLMAVEFL